MIVRRLQDVLCAAVLLNGFSWVNCFTEHYLPVLCLCNGFFHYFVLRNVRRVGHERDRLPLRRVVSNEFTCFLTLKMVRGVVLCLGAGPSVFARRAHEFHLFVTNSRQRDTHLHADYGRRNHLLTSGIRVSFLKRVRVTSIKGLRGFAVYRVLPRTKSSISGIVIANRTRLRRHYYGRVVTYRCNCFVVRGNVGKRLSATFDAFIRCVVIRGTNVVGGFRHGHDVRNYEACLTGGLHDRGRRGKTRRLPILLPSVHGCTIRRGIKAKRNAFGGLLRILRFLEGQEFCR